MHAMALSLVQQGVIDVRNLHQYKFEFMFKNDDSFIHFFWADYYLFYTFLLIIMIVNADNIL